MKIRMFVSILVATTLFTTSSYAVTPTPKPTTKASKTALILIIWLILGLLVSIKTFKWSRQ